MSGRAPALVVPDEQTWSVSGVDPASLGAEPVFEPAAVRRLLLPERLPEALVAPLATWLAGVPLEPEREERRLPFVGSSGIERLLAGHAVHAGHHEHEGQAHHDHESHHAHGHGGHDHAHMMAIVGEPSADGLVMEPIEVRLGSLGTPLPAGFVAEVTLDGDVVAECRLGALLAADDAVPDPLAPQAWQLALTLARERDDGAHTAPRERWRRIAALELERAVSHVAWLRAFARLLGWQKLIERCGRALAVLEAARPLEAGALDEADRDLGALAVLVHKSRALRWRTAGRGRISPERARELDLRGPVARASGVRDDARDDDPLYARLGFEPVVGSGGDALARTLVRTAEAAAAVGLAARAVRAGAANEPLPSASGTVVLEGPRGPLEVARDGALAAAGQTSALEAAGTAAVGAEWAAALVTIASFDLSPWRVGS